MSFRDLVQTIAPPWLQRHYGERMLYSLTLQVDAIAEAAREGVRARAPGSPQQPSDALIQIGRDRVLVRGKYESDVGYAERLQRAFDSWARAASLEGLTRSLQGLLRDYDTEARAVTWWGLWAEIPSWDGAVSYEWGLQRAWHWGWPNPGLDVPTYWDWGQVYVILYPAPGQWGQATLGSGLVLGSGAWSVGITEPPDVVQAARLVANQWRSATTRVRVIVCWDAGWPASKTDQASTVEQPTEAWRINHTVSGGESVPSRYLGAAYLDPVG